MAIPSREPGTTSEGEYALRLAPVAGRRIDLAVSARTVFALGFRPCPLALPSTPHTRTIRALRGRRQRRLLQLIVIWYRDDPDGNAAHVARHGVSEREVEDALERAGERRHLSCSTGRPITFGWTGTGRHVAVVWELICEDPRNGQASSPPTRHVTPSGDDSSDRIGLAKRRVLASAEHHHVPGLADRPGQPYGESATLGIRQAASRTRLGVNP